LKLIIVVSKSVHTDCLIPVAELDEVNREIDFGTNSHLDARNLKNMVMDVYYHPSKYVQAIRQMMNTYNLEHK
jgi:hypothetical protein